MPRIRTWSPRRRPHHDDEVTFAIQSLRDHLEVTVPLLDERCWSEATPDVGLTIEDRPDAEERADCFEQRPGDWRGGGDGVLVQDIEDRCRET